MRVLRTALPRDNVGASGGMSGTGGRTHPEALELADMESPGGEVGGDSGTAFLSRSSALATPKRSPFTGVHGMPLRHEGLGELRCHASFAVVAKIACAKQKYKWLSDSQ